MQHCIGQVLDMRRQAQQHTERAAVLKLALSRLPHGMLKSETLLARSFLLSISQLPSMHTSLDRHTAHMRVMPVMSLRTSKQTTITLHYSLCAASDSRLRARTVQVCLGDSG